MSASKEYIIQFAGLSPGENFFELNVNDKFFENLDYSEIKQGNILVKLNLLKQSTMMVLNFEISGTVNANCDKCAAEFDLPISGNYKLIVKVGGHSDAEEDDDIITVAANEHKIDLTQYLYEYITLSLPIKREHVNEVDCDKNILNKVNQFLIDEEIDEEKDEPIDPRWDGLKDIKLN
jgi:uncharacterized metal-binding protein YceD (DUF177 family)